MVCWFHSSPRKRVEFYRRIGRQISIRIINRRLLTAGYPSRRATRYPRLKRDHLRRRRQWARRHRDCDLRQWRHCVFSDESRFKLYRSDGWIRVRRHGGEIYWYLCETNRWQSGMGCLSLREQERASHCWRPHKPADTAQAAMTFLEHQDMEVMDWPAKTLIWSLLSKPGTKWLSIFVIPRSWWGACHDDCMLFRTLVENTHNIKSLQM